MAQSRDNESGACNLCPLLGHTARSLSEGAEEPDHPQTRGEELERGELAKWGGVLAGEVLPELAEIGRV